MSRFGRVVPMLVIGILSMAITGYATGETDGAKAKLWTKSPPLVGPGSKPVEISGKVTLPGGSPAPLALVKIIWPDVFSTYTDSIGRYKLTVTPNWSHMYVRLGNYVKSISINPDSRTADIPLEQGNLLKGKVLDEQTLKPIGGAEVLTYYHVRARTRADGTFMLGPVDQHTHSVAVVKPGYSRPVVAGSPGEAAMTIYLKPEGVVKGRITDDKGKPVPGALVRQSNFSFEWQYTKTDRSGHYALYGFDPNSPPLHIEAAAPGYGYQNAEIVFPQTGDRVLVKDFVLARGEDAPHDLSGRVFMPDGKPAGKVPVSCGTLFSYDGSVALLTSTDSEGRYAIRDIPSGKRYVVAHSAGMAAAFGLFEGKSDGNVDIKFSKGHWLRGRVLSGSGIPLFGAKIEAAVEHPEMDVSQLGWSYQDPHLRTITNPDGSFTLTDLPDGAVVVSVSGVKGYTEAPWLRIGVDTEDNVIRLQQFGRLTGIVTDAQTRKPVTDATIHITNSWSRQRGDEYTDTPSSPLKVDRTTGKFAIDTLCVRSAVRLAIDAKGYRHTVVRRIVVKRPEQETPVSISLEPAYPASENPADKKPIQGATKPGDEAAAPAKQEQAKFEVGNASVSGIVIDAETGKPAADSRVAMLRPRLHVSSLPEIDKWYSHFDRDQWWPEKSTTTDTEGRFAFNGLEAGQWVISASPRSRREADFGWFPGGQVVGAKIELQNGTNVRDVVMKLPQFGSCRIRVIDASTGETVKPWTLVFFSESGPLAYADGYIEPRQPDLPTFYSKIAPGRYTVCADAPGYYTASDAVEIKSGATSDLTIKLHAAQSIIFRLDEDANAEAVGSWRIGYKLSDPTSKISFERALGHYSSGLVEDLWGDPPREKSVVAAPGVYELDLILARNLMRNLHPEDIVWTGRQQVTVEQGKDAIVLIPFKELGLSN